MLYLLFITQRVVETCGKAILTNSQPTLEGGERSDSSPRRFTLEGGGGGSLVPNGQENLQEASAVMDAVVDT
jgi:hypothetical protein